MAVSSTQWNTIEFAELAARLLDLLKQPDPIAQIKDELARYISGRAIGDIELVFLDIISLTLTRDFPAILAKYEFLREAIPTAEHSSIPPLFNILWFDAQFNVAPSDNPYTRICHKNYMSNLKALRKSNKALADSLSKAQTHPDFRIIQFWPGMHFFDTRSSVILTMKPEIHDNLSNCTENKDPIAFDSINSGREIIYCLQNNFKGLHGMARPHYVLENDINILKSFLELDDLSEYIRNDEILFFIGPDRLQQLEDLLVTNKYPVPFIRLELANSIEQACERALKRIELADPTAQMMEYYQGPIFKQRLADIAAGRILPRVQVSTCLWTTYLKHCAADFERSFAELGCETNFIIEGSNTQRIGVPYLMSTVCDFKPDLYFMISHGRPSVDFLPLELPFFCFMQDRCGPIVATPDLAKLIGPNDHFICQTGFYADFLKSRNVSEKQISIMPVPVDDSAIFPMTTPPASSAKYAADVSFIKHTAGSVNTVWNEFCTNTYMQIPQVPTAVKEKLDFTLNELYQRSMLYGPDHLTEELVTASLKEFFDQYFDMDNSEHFSHNQAIRFIVSVATTAWRYEFLKPLLGQNFSLALYGNNWDTSPETKPYARGGLTNKEQLRNAYALSKINLHINNVCTMHQRLVECALAQGFIITAAIPPDKDWEPADKYFTPGSELIIAESPQHLLELCQYYLAHEDKRNEIAYNMHKKALAHHTMKQGTVNILNIYKNMLIAKTQK